MSAAKGGTSADKPADGPEDWFTRQLRIAAAAVGAWPDWMKKNMEADKQLQRGNPPSEDDAPPLPEY